jgi:hypothetical protein
VLNDLWGSKIEFDLQFRKFGFFCIFFFRVSQFFFKISLKETRHHSWGSTSEAKKYASGGRPPLATSTKY